MTADRNCCCDWADARNPCTDNEGYGPLLRERGPDGDWRIGCELPPVKFCPWCGADKRADDPLESSAWNAVMAAKLCDETTLCEALTRLENVLRQRKANNG